MLSFQTQRECIEHIRRLIEEAQQPNTMSAIPTEVKIQGCIYQVEVTPDHKIIFWSDWDPDDNRPIDSSDSQDVTTEEIYQTLENLNITASGTTAVSFLESQKHDQEEDTFDLSAYEDIKFDIERGITEKDICMQIDDTLDDTSITEEAYNVAPFPPRSHERPAIDLSHAEPALLRTLEGLSLTAQSRICNQWPIPSGMRKEYQDIQDRGTDGEPKPEDKPANIDGVSISPTMLKHRQRHFAGLSQFKDYVKEVFDSAFTASQAEWMTAGQCTIGRFKLYICWNNKEPHVIPASKQFFLKIHQSHMCREAKKILAHAMHKRFPDPIPEQEGATGYQ